MKKRNGLLAIGAGAAIIGFVLAGSTLAGSGVALAGQQATATPACDATATPVILAINGGNGNISAFQAEPTNTPIATCTPTKIKTHTPTIPPTKEATGTPIATNTPVPPPPPPPPPAGNAGVVVRPPATGSGGYGSTGSGNMLWVVIATALVIAGGSAMFVGARTKS